MKIVFLEDNLDLLFLFKTLARRHFGAEVFCYKNVTDFMSNPKVVLSADLMFLDVNLGPCELNGIDAYKWLQDEGYLGKIYFLTGHAKSHPLVQQATQFGSVVLQKPLEINTLTLILADSQSAKGSGF